MDRTLDEVVSACERLLAEARSGSDMHELLTTTTRKLRRAAHELRSGRKPTAALAASATTATTTTTTSASATAVATSSDAVTSSPTSSPSSPPLPHWPVWDDAELLAHVCYACRLALACNVSNSSSSNSSGGGGGGGESVPRSAQRLLTPALELAAVLLSSGLLADDCVAAPPPPSRHGGGSGSSNSTAQVFFARMFGRKTAPSDAEVTATTATAAAAAAATRATPLVEPVRDALVEAVVAVAPAVYARDVTDTAWFVYIAALRAAVVPQRSRGHMHNNNSVVTQATSSSLRQHRDAAAVGAVGSTNDGAVVMPPSSPSSPPPPSSSLLPQWQYGAVGVHGERLLQVMRLLFVLLARAAASSVLVDETNTTIRHAVKALTSALEQHHESLADDESGTATSVPQPQQQPQQQQQHTTSPSHEGDDKDTAPATTSTSAEALSAQQRRVAPPHAVVVAVDDFVRTMELCCATNVAGTRATMSSDNNNNDNDNNSGNGSSSSGSSSGGGGADDGVVRVALGAVLYMVVNGGPVFRASTAVLSTVQSTVVPRAVQASLSPDAVVFRLSLNILQTCCLVFRAQLVAQTAMVFRHVYFRVLESAFASLTQKLFVIEVLQRYVEEPQHLIGLFLNYDCNADAQSIYEELVSRLATLASPSPSLLSTLSFAHDVRTPAAANAAVAQHKDSGGDDDGGDDDAAETDVTAASFLFDNDKEDDEANDTDAVVASEAAVTAAAAATAAVPEMLRRRALRTLLLIADSNIQWLERFEDDAGNKRSNDEDDVNNTSSNNNNTRMTTTTTSGNATVPGDDDATTVAAAAASSSSTTMTTTTPVLASLPLATTRAAAAHDTATTRGDADDDDPATTTTTIVATSDAIDASATTAAGTDVLVDSPRDTHDGLTMNNNNNNNSSSSSRGDEAYLSAWRYKAAVKEFLYRFNVHGNVPAALSYLHSCPLLASTSTTTTTARTTAATAPTATTHDNSVGSSNNNDDEEAADSVEDKADDTADEEAAAAQRATTAAAFLKRYEDYLDKSVLGDYFARSLSSSSSSSSSSHASEARGVFEAWIRLHRFAGMTLDEALRLFLGGFKLLGEAQVVDKTMELFAAHYCRQNPGVFSSADTAFILAFSICMLNTDAHNPHVKTKMTRDGFVRNNRGIDEGNDVDADLLGGIYDRITRHEIVLRPSQRLYSIRTMRQRQERAHACGDGAMSDKVQLPLTATSSSSSSASRSTHNSTVTASRSDANSDKRSAAYHTREALYQRELHDALHSMLSALHTTTDATTTADATATGAAGSHTIFVKASSIEHALPMWDVTCDVLARLLIDALRRLCDTAERYVRPTDVNDNNSGGGSSSSIMVMSVPTAATATATTAAATTAPLPPLRANDALSRYRRAQAYMQDTDSGAYLHTLLRGLVNVVHVCCAYGTLSQVDWLLTQTLQLTRLRVAVRVVSSSMSSSPSRVRVTQVLPNTRLWLLSTFFSLFVRYGAAFSTRAWAVGYTAVSLIDALANGTEGLWRRRLQHGNDTPSQQQQQPQQPQQSSSSSAPPDVWFGSLDDAPPSIEAESQSRRRLLLRSLRAAPGSAVDVWLDSLFDLTRYPATAQVHMASGLARVCAAELAQQRTFALTKLFDFVTICAATATRLQWREVWSRASVVVVMAGTRTAAMAHAALDGLRIVALTYLRREELLNYSFQKEVLRPLELVLMRNRDTAVRQRVLHTVAELVDLRAAQLASGWRVVFSCLSHAAVLPEVAALAWQVCERAMRQHLQHVKDCFSDLIFCLTTFACTHTADERVPLLGVSYLVACAHWLQYGLEPPPPPPPPLDDVADDRSSQQAKQTDTVAAACTPGAEAKAVVQWALRFGDAEREARAAPSRVHVTLASEPLTAAHPLTKPDTVVSKTRYQLWMSLFEGIVPIIVMHSSVRVRAHAVCCLWALLRHYGSAFAADVQSSLFSGMLLPVLNTLVRHVPHDEVDERNNSNISSSHAAEAVTMAALPATTMTTRHDAVDDDGGAADVAASSRTSDYALLVYLSLHGMFAACHGNAALLRVACATFRSLVAKLPLRLVMLPRQLVDVLVRVCIDLVSATTTTRPAASRVSLTHCSTASQKDSGNKDDEHTHNDAATTTAATLFASVCDALARVGVVDVTHDVRAAQWVELQSTPLMCAASMSTIAPLRDEAHGDGHVDKGSALSATDDDDDDAAAAAAAADAEDVLRATVLECLAETLPAHLHRLARAQAGNEHGNDCAAYMSISRALRSVALGLCVYCHATHDVVGFSRLLDLARNVHTAAGDENGVDRSTSRDDDKNKSSSSSSSGDGAAATATLRDDGGDGALPMAAVELVLVVPYTCVLVEFVCATCHECAGLLTQAPHNALLRDTACRLVAVLQHSRRRCLAHALHTNTATNATTTTTTAATAAADERGDVCAFADVFALHELWPTAVRRDGDKDVAAAVQWRYHAWSYLQHLLALRCVLALARQDASAAGPSTSAGVLAACAPTATLLQSLCDVPSALEEAAIRAYMRRACDELGWRGASEIVDSGDVDDGNAAHASTLQLCVQLLQTRVRDSGHNSDDTTAIASLSPQ